MKEATSPTPIVAKSDAEALDGIRSLSKEVQAVFKKEREAQDAADLHALELGRMVCEFAAKPDVQARMKIINAKKNGAPKKAHCYIAELLADAEIGLSERHIERCARAWMDAQKAGLPINTSLRVVEASKTIGKVAQFKPEDVLPSPERLFKQESTEPKKPEPFNPEKDALTLAVKVKQFFYDEKGNPRLRTRQEKDRFMKLIENAFDELGIEWAIVPKVKGD